MSVTHADFTIERRYGCTPQQTFAAFGDPDFKREHGTGKLLDRLDDFLGGAR
jgi:hypothetical protein